MAKEPPMCYFYDADNFDTLEEMIVRVATAVRLQVAVCIIVNYFLIRAISLATLF